MFNLWNYFIKLFDRYFFETFFWLVRVLGLVFWHFLKKKFFLSPFFMENSKGKNKYFYLE